MKKLLILILLAVSTATWSQIKFPVHPSADGHYITDSSGKPVFLCGDTPWQLIIKLKKNEVIRYFDERRKQGYNAALIDLLSEEKQIMQVQCLCNPFRDVNFVDFNEEYFDYAEDVIGIAREKGFAVLLTVAYWGCCNDDEGWRNELSQVKSPDILRNYGAYLGKRFGHFDNIIWVLGGDSNMGKDKYELIREGLLKQDADAVFTYHTTFDELATNLFPAVNYNGVYVYSSQKIYELTGKGYSLEKPLPLIYTEGFYDNLMNSGFGDKQWTPELNSQHINHQMYTFLLSGGLGGFINGNIKMWAFHDNWKEYLNDKNSPAIIAFYDLVKKIQWWTLQPDTARALINSGRGNYGERDYITAATLENNRRLIAFIPNFSGSPARTFTINKEVFPAKTGFWIDPSTGKQRKLRIASGLEFTTPDQGTKGWVLVLERE